MSKEEELPVIYVPRKTKHRKEKIWSPTKS